MRYIKDKKYDFIKNCRNTEEYRRSLNRLTKKTYGFDFEQWYQDGYWTGKIPGFAPCLKVCF